jgi:hypothetical protein
VVDYVLESGECVRNGGNVGREVGEGDTGKRYRRRGGWFREGRRRNGWVEEEKRGPGGGGGV